MKIGRANHSAAQTATKTMTAVARNVRLGAITSSRSSEKIAISTAPTATADARQELLMPRPGVRTIASSMLYSMAG